MVLDQPQLQAMFETQKTWQHIGLLGGFGHQQTDQVVGQQTHPERFLVHFRRLAWKTFQTQVRLQIAQVRFDIPALYIELSQRLLRRLGSAQQSGHQHFAADFELAHSQLIGKGIELFAGHPVRADLRFTPHYDMISTSQTATFPEIRMTSLMLLEQHIRTLGLEQGNHEVGAVVAIRQDQVACGDAGQQFTAQGVFTAGLARIGSDRCIQQRARGPAQ